MLDDTARIFNATRIKNFSSDANELLIEINKKLEIIEIEQAINLFHQQMANFISTREKVSQNYNIGESD